MKGWGGNMKSFLCVFLISLALLATGCEGTETRDTVDDTVEEMAGKNNLDRYQQMKDDLGEIQQHQREKYRQLDENADDQ